MDHDDLLITTATLYYELDRSQQQIADRLQISRSSVSRLIAEARQRGIVTVQIHRSSQRDFVLEQELIEGFCLQDVYVLKTTPHLDDAALLDAVGMQAASYLQRAIDTLEDSNTIGVAWGTSVQAAVQALPNQFRHNVDVVQLLGGVGTLVVDSPDLARIVAVKLGGRHYDLPAPALLAHASTCDALLSEPIVRQAIGRARAVQLAITGVGTTKEETSSFLRAGLITPSELSALRENGAVGEMCGRFFDIDGCCKSFDINRRVIGVDLEDLRKIPHILAIARGVAKAQSILGALRGRFMNVLATDDVTARAILSLA